MPLINSPEIRHASGTAKIWVRHF